MNTMGCSMFVLAAAALVIGFIPTLSWISLVITLARDLYAMGSAAITAHESTAQTADGSFFWIAGAIVAVIVFRTISL